MSAGDEQYMSRTLYATLAASLLILLAGQCAAVPGGADHRHRSPAERSTAEHASSVNTLPAVRAADRRSDDSRARRDTSAHAGDTIEAPIRIESTGVRLGAGELREPLGIAVDNRGFIYVADAMTGKVFRYDGTGGSVEFDRPSRFASLYPIDVATFGPYVYVLDYVENMVLRYDYKGAYLDILLSFAEYERMQPVSLTSGGGGRIVTTDIENHALTVWTPLLDVEFSLGEYGWMEGDFNRPMKAAMMPDERLAVVDAGNQRVQTFAAAGAYERSWTVPDSLSFRNPRYICIDENGNSFVADPAAGRIVVFSPDGVVLAAIDSFGGEPIIPAACEIDWNGRLYAADLDSRSVLVYRLHYAP
jgi:DNA-binding beta-propeller fold protein YncE